MAGHSGSSGGGLRAGSFAKFEQWCLTATLWGKVVAVRVISAKLESLGFLDADDALDQALIDGCGLGGDLSDETLTSAELRRVLEHLRDIMIPAEEGLERLDVANALPTTSPALFTQPTPPASAAATRGFRNGGGSGGLGGGLGGGGGGGKADPSRRRPQPTGGGRGRTGDTKKKKKLGLRDRIRASNKALKHFFTSKGRRQNRGSNNGHDPALRSISVQILQVMEQIDFEVQERRRLKLQQRTTLEARVVALKGSLGSLDKEKTTLLERIKAENGYVEASERGSGVGSRAKSGRFGGAFKSMRRRRKSRVVQNRVAAPGGNKRGGGTTFTPSNLQSATTAAVRSALSRQDWRRLGEIGQLIAHRQDQLAETKINLFMPETKRRALRVGGDGVYIGCEDFWVEKISCRFKVELDAGGTGGAADDVDRSPSSSPLRSGGKSTQSASASASHSQERSPRLRVTLWGGRDLEHGGDDGEVEEGGGRGDRVGQTGYFDSAERGGAAAAGAAGEGGQRSKQRRTRGLKIVVRGEHVDMVTEPAVSCKRVQCIGQ
jgi:hypothetical protein